jgi:hypothetical protein
MAQDKRSGTLSRSIAPIPLNGPMLSPGGSETSKSAAYETMLVLTEPRPLPIMNRHETKIDYLGFALCE